MNMHPLIDPLPHLRAGWGREKVTKEQIRLATPLVEQGVYFRGFPAKELEAAAVAEFNARIIDGPTRTDRLQGVAALDGDGTLIGAVTLGTELWTPEYAPHETVLNCMVRYLAVDPEWRGQGIGTVLLCIMDQQGIPDSVTRRVFYGGCRPDAARFYQRAGFDVLQPNTIMPAPVLGRDEHLGNENADYSCWFIRTWSQQMA